MKVVREQVALAKADAVPRVCIFAAFNEYYAPLADIARPNWKAYAERHGYALRFYPEGYHEDPSRPQTYGDKGRFELYYELKGLCDIVMYLDIDSLFVNMDVCIEDVRNDFGPPSFLWTYGEGGPQSGLWIADTTDTTEKHLRYAYEMAARENNVRHGIVEPNGISDQDAMTRLMNVPPFESTFGGCLPMQAIEMYYPDTPCVNPWIVTCRGGTLKAKLETLTAVAAKGIHGTRSATSA